MSVLDTWRKYKETEDKFRALEKELNLPINSIRYEYEKQLVLSGVSIIVANQAHDDLLEIVSQTPFDYQTVISVHDRVKKMDIVKSILITASQRAIEPHLIVDMMGK